jgi:hypothetical protein
MTTAAALALLAGVSTADAQNASASNAKVDKTSDKTMEQSAAPKANTPHKTRIHQSMRMRHQVRETTGFGGHAGTIGSGRNDPSIHQSRGDRDSRDYPKQH